jgi:hypothetical protein
MKSAIQIMVQWYDFTSEKSSNYSKRWQKLMNLEKYTENETM